MFYKTEDGNMSDMATEAMQVLADNAIVFGSILKTEIENYDRGMGTAIASAAKRVWDLEGSIDLTGSDYDCILRECLNALI